MTEQITLEEALKLVEFEREPSGWRVKNVNGSVRGNVRGNVRGSVRGNVYGDVRGYVRGTINGCEWRFFETPREKLKRLIEEGADKAQLLEALNKMEDSND